MDRTCARLCLLVMMGAALVGCLGAPDDPSVVDGAEKSVINGTVDNGDPAVVMLRSGRSGYCTGTLISPTIVLTAAHCVDGITATSVGFGLNGQSTPVAVRQQVFHPDWDPDDLGAGNDIAVLVLASAVSGVTPIPVATDTSLARAGNPVRIVGFGNNFDNGAGTASGFGTKRQASLAALPIARRDGVSEDSFVKVGSADGTQTCNGDSGGPVFHTSGGVERVAGVTSFGFVGCVGGSFHTRVAAHLDFLADFIDVNGGGAPGNDTTAPTISLVSPANGSTLLSGRRAFVFNATDNVGVRDVTLQWQFNNTTVPCSAPPAGWTCSRSGNTFTFSARIGTGIRRFSATAVDQAGNAATGNFALQFR
jgi:hypothetical protein